MKVLNFGSLNIDYTYHLSHIVQPGETISSEKLEVFPGGKGLNQSIALARAGMEVYHAGLIGQDGAFLARVCEESGAHVEFIKTVEERSGNAIIQVSRDGQNSIILYPGANRYVDEEYIDSVLKHFEEGDILLLQNEINMIADIIEKAWKKSMRIFLNPSPFDDYIGECDLHKVDTFLMNEVEGFQITGEKEPEKILDVMKKEYPRARVVLTLGENGAYYQKDDKRIYQEAFKVQAIDTTAAGDTFTGYYMQAILTGSTPEEAIKRASKASSIAVTRKGASGSIPNIKELGLC